MSLPVIWSAESRSDYNAIIDHIYMEYGQSVAQKFILKIGDAVLNISKFPLLYKAIEEDERVRQAVLSFQTSMFYRVSDENILILRFQDNRMEPE